MKKKIIEIGYKEYKPETVYWHVICRLISNCLFRVVGIKVCFCKFIILSSNVKKKNIYEWFLEGIIESKVHCSSGIYNLNKCELYSQRWIWNFSYPAVKILAETTFSPFNCVKLTLGMSTRVTPIYGLTFTKWYLSSQGSLIIYSF